MKKKTKNSDKVLKHSKQGSTNNSIKPKDLLKLKQDKTTKKGE